MKTMSNVIGTLDDGVVKVEVYPDGDCLFSYQNAYFQIPVNFLKKIIKHAPLRLPEATTVKPAHLTFRPQDADQYAQSPADLERGSQSSAGPAAAIKEPEAPTAHIGAGASQFPGSPVDPALADSFSDGSNCKRRITRCEPPETGWECILMRKGREPVRHVYASRDLARGGDFNVPIGLKGRIR
jgi:hypothetical protein